MAERLTKKITKTIQDKYSLGSYLYYDFNGVENTNRLLNKLGELEDIIEKYGIEDLEQYLQRVRKIDKELRDTIQQLHTIINTIGYDRDTWKRACESMAFNYDKKLTCNTCYIKEQCSKQYGGNYEQALCNYFYQQAKTEGNDE